MGSEVAEQGDEERARKTATLRVGGEGEYGPTFNGRSAPAQLKAAGSDRTGAVADC